MADNALQPIEQKTVTFYEDELTAVVVEQNGKTAVYVPLRPVCESLGLAWSSQLQRIRRDPVLNDETVSVFVTNTESQRGGRAVECLPLEFLNGWLFGINASRVKSEIKDRLIRYQRECYRVLADAFLGLQETAVTPTNAALIQLHQMAVTIAETTAELIRLDARQTAVEGRIDKAATVVGDMSRRLTAVEKRVKAGPLTEEQAAEVKKRVNLIAQEMAKHEPGKSHYQAVYAALGDETGTSSYKAISPAAFETAVSFLDEWLQAVKQTEEK